MRYFHYDVVLQEVPGEVSLSFSIEGCPLACPGCFWKKESHESFELSGELFSSLLSRYEGFISCVLFLGGEWHERELLSFLREARSSGLQTCLYTGLSDVSLELKSALTYLKTGPYVERLGNLSSAQTNQRFIDLRSGAVLNAYFQRPS